MPSVSPESSERLDILDERQEPDGTHVVRINGLGTEFRSETREAALDLAVDELDRLLGSAEGRAEMRAAGLFERYAWVREQFAVKNAHVGAPPPEVTAIDEATFAAQLASGARFVIDFWAPWCQPCKQFGPVFERVAARLHDDVTFYAADLDVQATLGQHLEVLAVPTTIGFGGGHELFRSIGGLPEQQLVDLIRERLLADPPT